MTAPRYLSPLVRAVLRYIRAECGIVPVGLLAFAFRRSRQQIHNLVARAGITPGAGAELQDDLLRIAYQVDTGTKLTPLEWRRMSRLIEQEAADVLVRLIPRPKPNPELDRAMAELEATLKTQMQEWG
ncbi:hypothetical protein [Azospirillum formosense]|uniref:hypothetical protein n=1 Tax=Azospirillum formosense TaxID=861533 RepID=UPI00339054FE